MKNALWLALLLSMGVSLTSCKDEKNETAPAQDSAGSADPGAAPEAAPAEEPQSE